MNHPQTYVKNIISEVPKETLESIAKYGCCAFVLMWCLGIEPENDMEAVLTVARMIKAGAIDKDCKVKWASAIKYLTGRGNVEITFENITTLNGIKDRTPVRYDYDGKSHWVGVENGKIVFNPLEYSTCVEKGKPATMRKIKIKGVIE